MKIESYLRESPVFTINAIYEQIVTGVNLELRAEGVNLLQGLVLTALLFEEDPKVTPSQLAKTFQTSKGNISHAISHLEYKGLVKRNVSREDARKFHLELKPEGRKLAYRLIKFYDRLQEMFEEKLGVQACKKTVISMIGLKEAYQAWAEK